MSRKVYVGNLAWSYSSDDLKSLFSQYGTVVSAKVITDRETGRSRGFGFVEMESESQASQAIEALNNKEIEGRRLTVNEARERTDGPPPGGGGGSGRRFGGGGGGRPGGSSGGFRGGR